MRILAAELRMAIAATEDGSSVSEMAATTDSTFAWATDTGSREY